MTAFALIGRYFWLLALLMTGYKYARDVRSLASRDPADPRSSAAAIALRRWLSIASGLPWAVMGWGILAGGVPNIWYYLRPQDRNPYVSAWFATLFLIAGYFAFWVFFRDGAQKMALLQPVELRWHRTSFRGTTRGTVALTAGWVKLFAALAPFWIVLWIILASTMNVPLPK